MAGYSDNREQNYEIKYLRKVMGSVDKRVKVPESIDGDSLRTLLDDVAYPSPRETAGRIKRVTLRSRVAYAAAFVLVIALLLSTEIYKPDMIMGGMRIENQAAEIQTDAASLPDIRAAAETPNTDASAAGAQVFAQDENAAPEPAGGELADASEAFGVGGLESSLLLEADGYAYYLIQNDETDPDTQGYPLAINRITLETKQLDAQILVDNMTSVENLFLSNGGVVLFGRDEASCYSVNCYDEAGLETAVFDLGFNAPLGVRMYKDVLYVARQGDNAISGAVALPHSSDESAVVLLDAIDTANLERETKCFTGANGSVQLHSLNAYIHYRGVNEDGGGEDYIAQVILEGTRIELGSIS